MDKEEINFQEKQKLGSDALFWIRLANDSYFDLRNQMIVLSTILLPLSASIVIITKDSIVRPDANDKQLLLAGWIFLGLSILFGLIQTWVDSTYFKSLSSDSSLREHFRNNLSYDEAEKVVRLLPPVQGQSTLLPLLLQMVLLFGGLLMIMFVAAGMLSKL